jgi:hypothetical protein
MAVLQLKSPEFREVAVESVRSRDVTDLVPWRSFRSHRGQRHYSGWQADYLRFITDYGAPFDNNAAEGEIRMVRLREKVSGCLRMLAGAQDFVAIRSYLATRGQHGVTGYPHNLSSYRIINSNNSVDISDSLLRAT